MIGHRWASASRSREKEIVEPNRFAWHLTVSSADIDELDHVSNVVYLQWALEAARRHSDARGWDAAAYRREGATWVVRRHEIDYLRAARAGDAVTVTTWVESWKRVSCVRRTDIVHGGDGGVLVRVATTWAFVALDGGRPTPVPAALVACF